MSNQEDASENRANLSAKVCDYCLKQFLSTDPASEKEAMKNHLRVCHSQPQVLIALDNKALVLYPIFCIILYVHISIFVMPFFLCMLSYLII